MPELLSIQSARGTYGVELGGFDGWRERIASKHVLAIADARVLELHPRVVAGLKDVPILKVEAVEPNKTLAFAVDTILPFILDHGATRASTVVAIGGGIVQDLVGFACSILFRGLPWAFYPTTLLAQADSCIGSKTSLNHLKYKNLLGTFFPPKQLVVDAAFLPTLTDLDYHSGVGEIIKIHLLESEQATRELAADLDAVWSRTPGVVERYITRSLTYKKRYIERDEYDEGPRLVLNYGHCVGHALEAATDYGIPHGIAVMYGIAVANRMSAKRGLLPEPVARAMNQLVEPRLPLVPIAAKVSTDALLAAMRKDKKNIDGKLVVIGTEGYGAMKRVIDVAPDVIRAAWTDMIEELTR
jgi:3-dehydroquinate synthase